VVLYRQKDQPELDLNYGSGSHEHDGPFAVVAMEKEEQTRMVHEQRCGERKRFAHKTSQTLPQRLVPAFVPHEPFPRCPFLPLSAAPPG
jgi:hypothetical protein